MAVLVGEWLDLDLEALALLGVAAGAVVALVPDGTPGRRMSAYLVGILVALLGYVVRAAVMPDTTTGRALTIGLVILVGGLVAFASRDHLRWWAVLLGSGVFAGAYETSYAAAPPLVADTSVSTLTTLLFCSAIGFLTVAAVSGRPERAVAPTHSDEAMEVAR